VKQSIAGLYGFASLAQSKKKKKNFPQKNNEKCREPGDCDRSKREAARREGWINRPRNGCCSKLGNGVKRPQGFAEDQREIKHSWLTFMTSKCFEEVLAEGDSTIPKEGRGGKAGTAVGKSISEAPDRRGLWLPSSYSLDGY